VQAGPLFANIAVVVVAHPGRAVASITHAGLWSATATATVGARTIFEMLPHETWFVRDGDVARPGRVADAAELWRGGKVQDAALSLAVRRVPGDDFLPIAVENDFGARDPMRTVEASVHRFKIP
jgi:hypothetical protein